MNWQRIHRMAALGLAACGAVFAEPTNTSSKADYGYFKTVPDRNIFNPNRYPHRGGTKRTETVGAVAADAFALVGTLSYEKGTFAFFSGSSADYQKALESGGGIAGFKVAAIRPDAVLLSAGTNSIELKVGAQMRRDEEAGWQLVQEAGPPPAERGEAPAAASPAGDAAGDPGDVLKKLMQQREQELK